MDDSKNSTQNNGGNENENSNVPNNSNFVEVESNSSPQIPAPSEPNYQSINEESPSDNKEQDNIQESMLDRIGNLQNNLTYAERTDIKKSECISSTHIDKKEDYNMKKKESDSKIKNKKSANLNVENKIVEESEEIENKSDSFKNNNDEDQKENNYKIVFNKENQDNNINNKNIIDNKENNGFVDNEDRNYPKEDNNNNIEINEKEIQIINVIIKDNNEMASPENMEQKKIIINAKEVINNSQNIEDQGNFEEIKENLDNQYKGQLENIFEQHNNNNDFFEEIDKFYDDILNNDNYNNEMNNLNFKENRCYIILLNVVNCIEDYGNFEKIECCSNNQFNDNLFNENSFISEYDKLCDKENIG